MVRERGPENVSCRNKIILASRGGRKRNFNRKSVKNKIRGATWDRGKLELLDKG